MQKRTSLNNRLEINRSVHIWGKVIINVKANYLPQALLDSAVDCKNKCDKVLSAKIISGDKSAHSIVAQYIPNSRFSFSVVVQFGREPIGMFVLQVGIRPTIAAKYFGQIDASATISPPALSGKPSPRWGHSSCIVNHSLYIFGGFASTPSPIQTPST